MKKTLTIFFVCVLALASPGCGNANPGTPENNASSVISNEPVPEPEPEPEPEPDPAETYADTLTTYEQAAQMFFVRYPDSDAAAFAGKYNIGGYILFAKDFNGQTKESVSATLATCQNAVKTPMLLGVDEEGGTVVRVSTNPNLRPSPFRSPRSLYAEGGMPLVLNDTLEKDELLKSLGINVNLAPVCDFSKSAADFIYARACGNTPEETENYVNLVVRRMLNDNIGMVLKHFPGYGDNVDTHTGIAIDERPYEHFEAVDFLPFKAGINAGAQSVLVSHNVVVCMDDTLPASLSPKVHEILRNELGFEGVIMTDDLIMDAITQYTGGSDAAVLAVKAGNDMLISSDFVNQYAAVKAAIDSGEISPEQIREAAIRVIRWKMQLGLISNQLS